jgi:hypothetical protein
MPSLSSRAYALLIAALIAAVPACKSDRPPAKTAGNCAKTGAKTGWAGAKTGVKTGVEGVKQAGSAVGGFFEGGSEGASKRWNEGKARTKATANEGAAETSHESRGDCP